MAPAYLGNLVAVGVFLVSASVFMHLSARFWLEEVEFVRAVATVTVLVGVGGLLVLLELPTLLSLLVLVTATLITVQVAYDVDAKKAVQVFLVYMVITTIFGVLLNSLFRLLGWL
ncbi:MAG: hypothetical protein SV760_09375 [Halobacteria archaeon]|nr:hypothetical protein [Halobacteria archaeon]